MLMVVINILYTLCINITAHVACQIDVVFSVFKEVSSAYDINYTTSI